MPKSPSSQDREKLLQRVGRELGREISALTVFYHEGVARKLGLNATDTRCLSLIAQTEGEPVTAGDLGRATGLTTGAVTGIIDRLEAAGMVDRVRDASDRRKVFVRARPEAMRRVGALYEGLGKEMMALASGYSTDELALIDGFMEENVKLLKAQIGRLA